MSFNASQYQLYILDKEVYALNGKSDKTIDFYHTKDTNYCKILESTENTNNSLCIIRFDKSQLLNHLKTTKILYDEFSKEHLIEDRNMYGTTLNTYSTEETQKFFEELVEGNTIVFKIEQYSLNKKLWNTRKRNANNLSRNITIQYDESIHSSTVDEISPHYLLLYKLISSLIWPITNITFTFDSAIDTSNGIHIEYKGNIVYNDEILNKIKSYFLNKCEHQTITIEHNETPLNLLLKGVPGTGKSRLISKLCENIGALGDRLLRINIHSGTNNSDLMQGISVKTDNENILYEEKQGAVLQHLLKSVADPKNNYALVLEEIQENSLNKIIGDLIYLTEEQKRVSRESVEKIIKGNNEDLSLLQGNTKGFAICKMIVTDNSDIDYIKLPNLISSNELNYLVMPNNFYVFCTSNYRDDKKVIEDNLLRRFDIIELFPNVDGLIGCNEDIKLFFTTLNDSIEEVMSSQDLHPDRFTIGHSIWINTVSIEKPLLKVIIEFKDVKGVSFDTLMEIFRKMIESEPSLSKLMEISDGETNKGLTEFKNYKELIVFLQSKVYKDILGNE